MKLLVLSDTQLGSGQRLTDNRLAEQEAMLDQILDLADAEDVDAILHCGDIFNSRYPSEEARLVFKQFARRAVDGGARRFLAAAGNHDLRNTALPSPVDLYDSLVFARRPGVERAGGTAIALLPWTPPHHLVASRNGSDRETLHADTAALLLDTARELRAQCEGEPAILALHWAISGAALPSGLPVEQMPEPIIPLSELVEIGFDAVLGGHIHCVDVLHEGPPVIVCGSPWVNDFGESEQRHGVWLLDTASWSRRFVAVDDHRFVTLDVDPEAPYDLRTDDEPDLADAVVRVRYTATAEQARRVDHAVLTRALLDAGAHKVAQILPTIIREDRARVSDLDESVSELDAFERWLDVASVPESLRGALRERAARDLEAVR